MYTEGKADIALPDCEVTCGHLHYGFTWEDSSLFYLQGHWGSWKKIFHPVRQSFDLSSKPSLGLETGHFSPNGFWASHTSNTPWTLDLQCHDQALYKIHFNCWFPYKRWVEEAEEMLPIFYATVSLWNAAESWEIVLKPFLSCSVHGCSVH